MSITIYDVAKVAGVSHTTVSNVINKRKGNFPVSEKTRERVWHVIRETGYVPSFAARALALRRTNVIACLVNPIVGAFTNDFYREVFMGVEEAVLKSRFSLLIASAGDYYKQEPDGTAMPMLLEPDGYLVFAASAKDDLTALSSKPVVLVSCDADCSGCSRVSADDEQGARLAVEHLLSLGHEKIAVLRGAKDNTSAEERFSTTRSVLAEHGVTLPDELVAFNFGNAESGYASAKQVLERSSGFTAVTAFNDGAAIGAIRAFREAGLRVPEDVSVVGFDNVTRFCEVKPALTTIDVPTREIGRRAARILVEGLESEGKREPREERLPVSLVVGETTAKPGKGWKMAG